MIDFGIDGEKYTDMAGWAKHHKQISVLVKREYLDDGEVINPKSEKYINAIENHKDRIIEKKREVIHRETFKKREVLDSYLVLDNLKPIKSDVDYYSVGAMNTEQTTYMKLVFLLEDVKFILDYRFKSSGSYASTFSDMIDSSGIRQIINDIAYDDKDIREKGIMIEPTDNNDYFIVGVRNYNKEIVEFEVDEDELVESLIAVEIYKYDMEIID